jgi:hypothetical protein
MAMTERNDMDQQAALPPVVVPMSAWIGHVKASRQFCSLTVLADGLRIRRLSKRFDLSRSELRSIDVTSGFPGISKQIQIRHTNRDCPGRVIFWCPLARFTELAAALGQAGYAVNDQSGSTRWGRLVVIGLFILLVVAQIAVEVFRSLMHG